MANVGMGRPPIFAILGVVLAVLATFAYSFELVSLGIPTPQGVLNLVPFAEAFFALLVASMLMFLFDVRRALLRRVAVIGEKGVALLSPGWIVPYVFSVRRYRRCFLASALVYGAFYAVITSMVVYQPTVNFAQTYGAPIPSVQVTPLQAAPFFSPVVTVYLVNHLGLLFIPLTTLLLVATSILVGLYISLAAFAFDSRAKGAGKGWVGGIGALVGLFTGCPTCAGLFFASFFGGASAASFVAILGLYQPEFILLSIPVLLVAPFLTSRSLSKVFRDGCVVVQNPRLQQKGGGGELGAEA